MLLYVGGISLWEAVDLDFLCANTEFYCRIKFIFLFCLLDIVLNMAASRQHMSQRETPPAVTCDITPVYRPNVPLLLHWHLPCVQKWPHMQRKPEQHSAYLILAFGRQKSPHRAHQFPLLAANLSMLLNSSMALLSPYISLASSSLLLSSAQG